MNSLVKNSLEKFGKNLGGNFVLGRLKKPKNRQ
jgi:hypothetical protein